MQGALIFITGLSDAGKTTLSRAIAEDLKGRGERAILLDGDTLRECLGDFDYSTDGRRCLAMRYIKIATMLANQGFIVVLATISMFSEVREFGRKNNKNYLEIFLDISQQLRRSRDSKGHFSERGSEMAERALDLPKNSDIILKDGFDFEAARRDIVGWVLSR